MSCKILGTGPEASAFAKALGIDPKSSRKIELCIEANEIVTVVIHRFVDNTELESLTDLIQEFELHKKEDES